MAITQIPTSQELPYYTQKTSLDGETFTLEFKWNIREEAWYMSVLTDDETPIQLGVKVVSDWFLLRRITDANKPLGQIMAYDTTGNGEDPGFSDLGTRVLLLYLDEAEIESLS